MDQHGEFIAELISKSSRAYAAGVVERQLSMQPDVFEKYGSNGYDDLAGDTSMRLLDLAEALATARPQLFESQVAWLKVAMTARRVPVECLRVNLQCIHDELQASLPPGARDMPGAYLERAIAHLEQAPGELPSILGDADLHVDMARRYLLAILETRKADAIQLILGALDDSLTVADIYRHVISPVQTELGRMWQMAEIHVGEEHYGTAVTAQAMALLRERMPRSPSNGHRVLCTSASGDLHDLGLQMVSDHFEMAGWESIHLGASTPAADLIWAAGDFSADILAISTSVVLQVRATAQLIRSVRAHGLHPDIPILVGGSPFQAVPDLWQVVGADGFAMEASQAPGVATDLVGGSQRTCE